MVVFDGYESSTKDHEHKHRTPIQSLEIEVTDRTVFDSTKALFLSNPKNKQKFVSMLAEQCVAKGTKVIRCEADAEVELLTLKWRLLVRIRM